MYEQQVDQSVYIFYKCELEPGELTLGGPELAEQSTENRHILEWVEIEKLPYLNPIFPKPDPVKLFGSN